MSHFDTVSQKIIPHKKISEQLLEWQKNNEKIVFTNGCFDILHYGHIQYLSKAADLGTKLIIGLNSDSSVKRLKGEDRPINNEKARAAVLASLFFVDAVVLFTEDTPLNLIEKVQPKILVKGGDYEPKKIVGYDFVTKRGGEVITIDFINGFSSTSIIKKGELM